MIHDLAEARGHLADDVLEDEAGHDGDRDHAATVVDDRGHFLVVQTDHVLPVHLPESILQ